MQSFTDLKVWEKAHQLVILIYKLTKDFPPEERFSLASQIKRAAVSIASNIAEGFQRSSSKVSRNFYDIADGSIEEVKYQLLLSRDLGYIKESDYLESLDKAEEVSKMLRAWIRSQRP